MSAPIFLVVPDRSADFVVAKLRQEGLTVDPLQPHSPDFQKFVCKRGQVSFELSIGVEPLDNACVVAFLADLSDWTRWNWPVKWLASIPLTRRQVRLLNDARAILIRNGAKDFPANVPGMVD